MSRVTTSFCRLLAAAAALAFAIAIVAPAAQAASGKHTGQWRSVKSGGHAKASSGAHGKKFVHRSKKRWKHSSTGSVRYSAPAVHGDGGGRSGVVLSSGRNLTRHYQYRHSATGPRHWTGHAGRRHGPKVYRAGRHSGGVRINNLAVAIAGNAADEPDVAAAPGGALIEGACAPGQFCTVRLGPYANSPKIITLNEGAVTIPPAQ